MDFTITRIRHTKRKTMNELLFKDIYKLIKDNYSTNDVCMEFKKVVDDVASRKVMNTNNFSYVYNLEDSYKDISIQYSNREKNKLSSRIKANSKKGYCYNKDTDFHKNTIYKVNRFLNSWITELPIAISNDKLLDNFDKYLVFMSYDYKKDLFYFFQFSRVNMFNDFQLLFDKDLYRNYAKMYDGILYDSFEVLSKDLDFSLQRLKDNNFKISFVVGAKSDLIDNNISLDKYLSKVNYYYKTSNSFFCVSGNDNFDFDKKYFVKN